MAYSLGIDVGGTNTDAALFDLEKRAVAAYAKVPTNHFDYGGSIDSVLCNLFSNTEIARGKVVTANISTTLSTNAILERKTCPVNLILIGYAKYPKLVRQIEESVAPTNVLLVQGGHNSNGDTIAKLDIRSIAFYAKEHCGELFAISGFFSPRNPEHELEAKETIETIGCWMVTCGHELAHAKLNAVKRTTTAYLNAALLPIIDTFIAGAERTLQNYRLDCPVMFLKSDSTLVSAAWCKKYPIETVFSGPAASIRGAYHLLNDRKESEIVIADIGGTSTDIGNIKNGKPVFSEDGAIIGKYRTMTPSLHIHSIALGGDSCVILTDEQTVRLDTRKTMPICRSNKKETSPKWGDSMEPGFTVSDAINALGKAQIDHAELSAQAAAVLGEKMGVSAAAFAQTVWNTACHKFEKNICEAVDINAACLHIYVGTPGPIFAEAMRERKINAISMEDASVASAIGAAISVVALECEAVVVHSFDNESYYAFLPHKKINSVDLEDILSKSEQELSIYLKNQAIAMGIQEGRIVLKKSFSYLGGKMKESTLISVHICAKFQED